MRIFSPVFRSGVTLGSRAVEIGRPKRHGSSRQGQYSLGEAIRQTNEIFRQDHVIDGGTPGRCRVPIGDALDRRKPHRRQGDSVRPHAEAGKNNNRGRTTPDFLRNLTHDFEVIAFRHRNRLIEKFVDFGTDLIAVNKAHHVETLA